MKFGNKQNRVWKMVQEKGYYIVLILCVAAVGISGYIFISTAIRQSRLAEEQLSVPTTVDKLPGSSQQGAQPTVGEVEDPAQHLSQEEKDELLRQEARRLAVAPVKGEIICPFSLESLSYNATTRDWRLHDAVDIACSGGEVLACMAGTVTEVYEDDLLGTTVVIAHDGGYETRYSNLTEKPTVKVGDQVSAGAVIGAVGNTAMTELSDQPHLHFQVLEEGKPIDPTAFLS